MMSAPPGTMVTLIPPTGARWTNVSIGDPSVSGGSGNLVPMGSFAPVSVPVPPTPVGVIATSWQAPASTLGFELVVFGPPGATASTPITDSALVSAVQNMINQLTAKIPGLQSVPVNGNPSDPTFQTQLAALQNFIKTQMAQVMPGVQMPIPTNGTLDYATYAMLSSPA